jgi:hypothetical protein
MGEKAPRRCHHDGRLLFFRHLQNEKSDLLNFRAAGSKWQIVHGWIQDRMKD